jgi:gliding motility-associated-like protein
MKKASIVFLLSFYCLSLCAQKEWSNWYIDGNTLLTFKNGYAQVEHNFINPVPPYNDWFNYYNWGHGGISYSDPATGDMKFIVSERVGFGSDFESFPNEYFIRSCPDDYSYHIIPFSNDPDKFYLIQFQSCLADLLQQESGLQVRCPNAIGLGYSIVDLSLNGGKGDISLINQVLGGPYTEQITTVKHANGKDVWVIVHPYNSGQFNAILVTGAGIQAAVASTVGPNVTGRYINVTGKLTASHDGKLLAGFSPVANGLQLIDFDNATGKLSNYNELPYKESVSKIQFSPDNSKLYYINYNGIYQYDLNKPDVAGSLTKIYGEDNGLIYDMQLAPDGKIYVTKTTSLTGGEYKEYMGVIECPNLPQYACNFNAHAMDMISIAFPDLVNDFIQQPKEVPPPQFSLGNDTSVCFGSYTISAPTGWESYRWNTGETTQSITVNKAGTYYVLTGNTGFSCPSAYGYINIGDKAIKLNLGPDTLLCHGQDYLLHIDNDYNNITWQNGSHTRDSTVTTGNAYMIKATDKNGCFTSDTMSVGYKYVIADFGPDTTLCNSESLALQLIPYKVFTQGASYGWQDGSTNDNYKVTAPGKYWGTVSYNGCTISDTINVNYISAENVYLGNDTTLCMGDSLLLQSNIANAKYVWNTGDTTRGIYVKRGGAYSVTVGTSICTFSDTINVTFNAKPSFSLGNDTAICNKEKLTLSAGNNSGDYLWQDGSAGNNFIVQSQGLYWLKLTQNGCSFSDSIQVTYNSLPQINLGSDTGICRGQSLLLNAYNPAIHSYLWQDGAVESTYLVKAAGSYSVKVSGINGCVNSDTLRVTVADIPSFSLGGDTVLCDTKTLSYNFNFPGAGYLWNDGTTLNRFTIYSAGTYSLRVTQAGCSNSDTIKVNYKPLPFVNIGRDTTLCNGNSVTLNAFNAGASYLWQNNSTASYYNVVQAGLYYVLVNLDGCGVSDSVYIKYKNAPMFTLGNDTLICISEQLVLQPKLEGGVNYLWQDGSTQPQYIAKDSGVYRLRVSNECGTASDDIRISTYACSLDMPNAFTPNGDGLNDIFRVKYPFPVKDYNMSIYNQWGQRIFMSDNIMKGWDGTFHGSGASTGVYVWVISLTDTYGKKQNAKGTVTLMK